MYAELVEMNPVFKTKKPKKGRKRKLPHIKQIYGYNKVSGDIGIEVEVEGKKLPKDSDQVMFHKYWRYEKDHSLRGEENAEYILRKPIPFYKVPKAFEELWAAFHSKGSSIDDSNRTSIHVHLNCTEMGLSEVASFGALYFTLEELLTEWCGDHRVGNLFCLRAVDAPAVVSRFCHYLKKSGNYRFSEGMHYSGFNYSALQKFGSIEIRTLRGVQEKSTAIKWVDILQRVFSKSKEFSSPAEIAAMFSSHGPTGFLAEVMGDQLGILMEGLTKSQYEIEETLLKGIRISQDICYCMDWEEYSLGTPSTDSETGLVLNTPSSLSNLSTSLGSFTTVDDPTNEEYEEELNEGEDY